MAGLILLPLIAALVYTLAVHFFNLNQLELSLRYLILAIIILISGILYFNILKKYN